MDSSVINVEGHQEEHFFTLMSFDNKFMEDFMKVPFKKSIIKLLPKSIKYFGRVTRLSKKIVFPPFEKGNKKFRFGPIASTVKEYPEILMKRKGIFEKC